MIDPVMRDLNRHLSDLDAAEARDAEAERLLEDEDWVRAAVGEFALSHVEWEWVEKLCRRVQAGKDCTAMLGELRKRIDAYVEEEARG